ncbi:MAG: TlpA family protein disulfide reductase [Phycisphaerales bacterium]|nr:TlpA family protein disulfide reductase [Phycisphaerales bacterium]
MHTVHIAAVATITASIAFVGGCAGTQHTSRNIDTSTEGWADRSARDSKAHAEAMVGTVAPDFTVESIIDGQPEFTLSNARGEVVLLAFWIRGCSACTNELPKLAELADWAEDSDLPVSVVTVHNDMGWHPALSRSMPGEEYFDGYGDALGIYAEGIDDEFEFDYGTRSWPRAFVIDADGTITHVKTNSGIDFVAELKDEVLAALPEEEQS